MKWGVFPACEAMIRSLSAVSRDVLHGSLVGLLQILVG